MILNVWLNGKKISEEISADTLLIDFVRKHGCSSVKRGCDTSNCGLCTLFVEDKPVLSCSMLAARVDGKHITTLEGLQEEAWCFHCQSRCRTMRFLQSRFHHECHCFI